MSLRQGPFASALLLALGPAIGIGIARFAYGLILPAMKADLDWSYFQSGLMNTINALGYLVGAFMMGGLTRRLGAYRVFVCGIVVTVIAVLLVATTRNFTLLGLYRLASGLSGAAIFVAGGTLASGVAHASPARSGLVLSTFYAGPGLGIALTAIAVSAVFQAFDPTRWQLAWLTLGTICFLAGLVTLLLPRERVGSSTACERKPGIYRPAKHWKILCGYTLFGAGSIGYMTFTVTSLQENGTGSTGAALFWLIIGLSSIAAPLIWGRVIGHLNHGHAFAILTAVNALGALLPLLSSALPVIVISAVIFGSSFFTVVASTTAFAIRNAGLRDLPKAIAFFTVAFGGGQAAGPLLVGFISDQTGSVQSGLMLGVFSIVIGAVLAVSQRDD